MLTKATKSQAGLSIIEIIIAVSLFAIISASSMGAILGSFSTSRLGEEQNQANFLALQGIEAVTSIRNQDWANMSNGTFGLNYSGDSWTFSGTSDTDPSGKFTRVITISDVGRDGNNNIVGSGGTVDSETKRVVSTVTWDFTPTRNNSIIQEAYLTNWQKSVNNGGGPPIPSPTPTPTPSPSPSPITSCAEYCVSLTTYSGGTCRNNPGGCNSSGETHESGGNIYCTGGNNADTCCCAP
jgi:type II secretory pathway pseudopilin PulG